MIATVRSRDAAVRVWVRGEWRICPPEWWTAMEGPKPPDDWKGCNGCTMSPDYLLGGFHVWPACAIHDWHYTRRVRSIDRRRADDLLRLNLWRVLRAQRCPWWRAAAVALVYYGAVRLLGGHAWRPR